MENKKLAYLPMAVDMIHPGHLNIINEASKLGATVMVGCYADEAIASYKRLPFMNFEQRKKVVESIKGVDIVVKQESRDLEENIRKYKPDYVVHGTDWRDGALAKARQKTIEVLEEWGGELVEPEYTQGISSTVAHEHIKEVGTTPLTRQMRLRKLLAVKEHLRGIEVHNGLSALVVENAVVKKVGEPTEEFDVFWLDSLTSSLIKGKQAVDVVDFSSRCEIIKEIFDVTSKPLIYDDGKGGTIEQFKYEIKTLERMGVSAIAIAEGNDVEYFCERIKIAKKTQVERHFMIIARIESLILEQGMDDAIARAKAYLNAGADGIMIHSRKKEFDEVKEFCSIYNKIENRKPLIVVPSSYSHVTEEELAENGVNVVIYANQLLRAAYPAMMKTAETILQNKGAQKADKEHCMSIREVINLIPGDN